MLVLAIRHWKIGAGAVLGAILMLGWTMAVTVPNARQEGRELERAAALARSMEIIKERSETDAEIGRMSDRELCAALGGSWVQDGRACD